ncbi:MAG: lysine 2,3-aminomutase, partial [Calditrichaeota bacterium]
MGQFLNIKQFLRSPFRGRLSQEHQEALIQLTKVFPFKVSRYVLEELIDWSEYDRDPIYRLVFPRREMLRPEHWELLRSAQTVQAEKAAVFEIRKALNPHPDGQLQNVPLFQGQPLEGIQHKYRETVLFFPKQGQTCHSFCTYCFRWAQFVNTEAGKFRSNDREQLAAYLQGHPEVTDLLLTGGDPMFMNNQWLFHYLDILNRPELAHVRHIRIGTKALAYFPHRFLGEEGQALLSGLNAFVRSGKHVTIMAHFSHPRELSTPTVQQAIQAIRQHGIEIRTQAPLVRGINDEASIWAKMWKLQVRLGMIPYYMFVERDTGAHHYFSVPLARAYHIFTEAYSRVSGLVKTVRGPSMSHTTGKVLVDGILEWGGEKFFLLKYLQARQPSWINRPFLARYDEKATWLDELDILPNALFQSAEASQ